MAMGERLRKLDNRVLGQPLSRDEAEAKARQRRVRPSRTLAALAAIAPILIVLKAAGVMDVAWWRPVVGLVATYIFGVGAWRLHRKGL